MSLYTVTIGTDPAVEVYGDLTVLDPYINGMVGAGPKKYRALVTASNTDDRKRLAIAATRWIDSWQWQGTADAFGGTVLAFPRTTLTNPDGSAATDAQQLVVVRKAFCELVALLAGDDSVLAAADTGSNVKALGAGSSRIEFFRGTSAELGTATLLPTVIDRLIGRWLASADASIVAAAGGAAFGTSTCSDFEDSDEFDLVDPA